MTAMLAPDLLDRRALGLIAIVDPFGQPVRAGVSIGAPGVRLLRKDGGRFAVLEADTLAAYAGAFPGVPGSPALRSRRFGIAIRCDDRRFASRSAEIRLPRDADPARRATANSLFQPMRIALLPTPACPVPANAAAVRVTVRHADGRRVGNTLVRVRSTDGAFTGQAVTDGAGEALVILPAFPMSFATNDASVSDGLAATVGAVADPDSVILRSDAAVLAGAHGVPEPFPDPDALAAIAAPAGVAVRLSARAVAHVDITWTAP